VAELTGLTILPQVGPVSFCTSPVAGSILEGFRTRSLVSPAHQIVARPLLVHRRTEARTLNQSGGNRMKRILTSAVLCLTLALSLAAPAAQASQNKNSGKKPAAAAKMSPRAEALKKCNDDYAAAVKKANDDHAAAVKAATGKKGKDRAAAMKAANKDKADAWTAAKKAKADCVKAAPKK